MRNTKTCRLDFCWTDGEPMNQTKRWDLKNKMNEMGRIPELFQIMHSGDQEWPGYKDPDDDDAPVPLLIAEIFRLVPYIGEQYIQFHPKNMPEVKIDRIEVIGIVTNIAPVNKFLSYTVDDGTSAISVLCCIRKLNRTELQESEYRQNEPTGSTEDKSSSPEKIPKSQLSCEIGVEPPSSYDRSYYFSAYQKFVETRNERKGA
ncbi:uncharacterized protein LOC105689093 isoform X2 [Athalia rosae]|uniref:uncharacterized protein LOC105689093 isoform X2 n=1 Tax=Athalia rosae TaxID=37344 RepID=UPI0020337475|nr:uncharacterized protein LOC105689093 isoform X2 [Athalia rosae]